MITNVQKYSQQLFQVIDSMEFTDSYGKQMTAQIALDKCLEIIEALNVENGKIIVVGNGGSAAIASHTAIDYLKNGDIHTVSFNEASLLTCFGNDYGYEYVFSKPIEKIAAEKDVLIAISSSGKSKNILNAVESFSKVGKWAITLSGFEEANPLRKMGDINIYAPSMSYGFVELAHQIFLHMVLDIYNEKKKVYQDAKKAEGNKEAVHIR